MKSKDPGPVLANNSFLLKNAVLIQLTIDYLRCLGQRLLGRSSKWRF